LTTCATAAKQAGFATPRDTKAKPSNKALKEKVRAEKEMLESVIKELFDRSDEPDIFQVRDCLSRLARLSKRPNTTISGDWVIFWASREGCVDRLFGSGITEEEGGIGGFFKYVTQEYYIRIGSRKDGRSVEGAEVLRKVGPFPNQFNSFKGTYEVIGTTGLRIVFNKIQTDEEKDLEVKGEVLSEKTIEVDVIYSSKGMVCLQKQDSAGEFDFFVLTPVEDVNVEVNKLLGAERKGLFFS